MLTSTPRTRAFALALSTLLLGAARCTNPFLDGPLGSVAVGTGDDGGTAVTCTGDPDCPFGQVCTSGTCRNADQGLHDNGCERDADCPVGNLCAESTGRCVPAAEMPEIPVEPTGACSDGQRRVCGTKVGACRYGTESCVDGGWAGDCEGEVGPAPETCDALDNDCDGDTDEGFTLGGTCSAGMGVCRQEGNVVCRPDGTATTCSVSGLDPSARVEQCGNNLDDDCDGAVDEGFTLGAQCFEGVGACRREGTTICSDDLAGTRCSATAGAAGPAELCGNDIDDNCDGQTDEGFDGVIGTTCMVMTTSCQLPGTWQCTSDALDKFCQQPPPMGELCNGIDDNMDADMCVDEGFDIGAPCTGGLGVCRVPGVKECRMDGTGTQCNATGLNPAGRTELCGNGLDDDCDGSSDEGFPDLGTVCDIGQGICRRQGSRVCSTDRLSTVCQGLVGAPDSRGELCGNSLDDDCDGSTDEGFDVGASCTNGVGVCTTTGTKVCRSDGLGTQCNAVPPTGGTELCGNTLDDDCDGFTDEGFANLGSACSEGLGLCARTGTYVCSTDRRSTVCNAQPTAPVPEICDNLDNDCDGTVDNGCDDDNDDYCDAAMMFGGTTPLPVCPRTMGANTRDCNDMDAAINPGAAEVCGDNRDQNCNGDNNDGCGCTTPDADFDGVNNTACGGNDCDDTNGSIKPGAMERCDGVDNNCNMVIDEGFDADNDNYTTCGTIRPAGGLSANYVDCDDTNAARHPFACELCANASGTVACGATNDRGNNVDEDCDGYVDETCAPCSTADPDGDGVSECDGDCAPSDGAVSPDRTEVCDGKDTDCNRTTVDNCDVSDRCNWPGYPTSSDPSPDQCGPKLICVESLSNGGRGTGNFTCTSLCNQTPTPPGIGLGDSCTATQSCTSTLTPTANLHGCVVNADIGTGGVGASCSRDTDCRSASCFGTGPGKYCTDKCGSDAYCGNGTVCYLLGETGYCLKPSSSQTRDVGATCNTSTEQSACRHGTESCITAGSGKICTAACCKEADCPSGYFCSFNGNDAPGPVGGYDTVPVCFPEGTGAHDRPAGAACTSNGQCRSEFCELTLNVCVEPCCNDSVCPTGLACETAQVVRASNRNTFARVCMNLSPTDPIQPK